MVNLLKKNWTTTLICITLTLFGIVLFIVGGLKINDEITLNFDVFLGLWLIMLGGFLVIVSTISWVAIIFEDWI